MPFFNTSAGSEPNVCTKNKKDKGTESERKVNLLKHVLIKNTFLLIGYLKLARLPNLLKQVLTKNTFLSIGYLKLARLPDDSG